MNWGWSWNSSCCFFPGQTVRRMQLYIFTPDKNVLSSYNAPHTSGRDILAFELISGFALKISDKDQNCRSNTIGYSRLKLRVFFFRISITCLRPSPWSRRQDFKDPESSAVAEARRVSSFICRSHQRWLFFCFSVSRCSLECNILI